LCSESLCLERLTRVLPRRVQCRETGKILRLALFFFIDGKNPCSAENPTLADPSVRGFSEGFWLTRQRREPLRSARRSRCSCLPGEHAAHNPSRAPRQRARTSNGGRQDTGCFSRPPSAASLASNSFCRETGAYVSVATRAATRSAVQTRCRGEVERARRLQAATVAPDLKVQVLNIAKLRWFAI
jgi:hypothetical protein